MEVFILFILNLKTTTFQNFYQITSLQGTHDALSLSNCLHVL